MRRADREITNRDKIRTNMSVLYDMEEKRQGLQIIMEHNTGKSDWNFPEAMLKKVGVFKLEVTDMACKEHL